ncbi:hypothetical protein K461DRAFT_316964 [Myriangium duriaei CBS 260.36]|uniref:Uncharacterized protein n=1 Tax=Myriangium duriaei CBS 260.36 TaxID=1168546 RepID=A0A9P4MKX0_9PEZI|nr:hypothetical protein K461DRAFT_316964 [Myriangium duriaei CBS 260.36]
MNHVLPCYPSTISHSSTTLSPDAARTALAAYLDASTTHAYHHPDAVLTPGGVTFSAASGPRGNLTISNLRRIERGLDGEDLAPTEDELAGLEETRVRTERNVWGGKALEGIGKSKDRGTVGRSALKKGSSFSEERDGDGEGGAENEEGWVDGEEYALSRDVLEGEVGERDEAAGVNHDEDDVPEVVATDEVNAGEKRKLTADEKLARKADKKKRHKALQKEKEQKKSGK